MPTRYKLKLLDLEGNMLDWQHWVRVSQSAKRTQHTRKAQRDRSEVALFSPHNHSSSSHWIWIWIQSVVVLVCVWLLERVSLHIYRWCTPKPPHSYNWVWACSHSKQTHTHIPHSMHAITSSRTKTQNQSTALSSDQWCQLKTKIFPAR